MVSVAALQLAGFCRCCVILLFCLADAPAGSKQQSSLVAANPPLSWNNNNNNSYSYGNDIPHKGSDSRKEGSSSMSSRSWVDASGVAHPAAVRQVSEGSVIGGRYWGASFLSFVGLRDCLRQLTGKLLRRCVHASSVLPACSRLLVMSAWWFTLSSKLYIPCTHTCCALCMHACMAAALLLCSTYC